MHDGILPYVGIWDRKPFGLFAIYYLIAGISRSVWAYQIAGCLFSSLTAWLIYCIARRWTAVQGAACAGFAYLALTCAFYGAGGQSPVFYNAFVAFAVWLIVTRLDELAKPRLGRPVWAAMLLLGLAVTIKTTVLFEALFMGGYVVATLALAGTPTRRLAPVAAGLMLVGMLPTLIIAAIYAFLGHWHEYWQAMVISNLQKQPLALQGVLLNLLATGMRASVLLFIAACGVFYGIHAPRIRLFLLGWLAAAVVGYVSVPRFVYHYSLPLLVPLCVISAFIFARGLPGRAAFAALLCFDLLWFNPLAFATTRRSAGAMSELAGLVLRHDGGGGLFVFDGPPYLYALTGRNPLSPLVFPQHLSYLQERNVSHIDTISEVRRILRNRPGVVVMGYSSQTGLLDPVTSRMVTDYVHGQCRLAGVVRFYQFGVASNIEVYGDCPL